MKHRAGCDMPEITRLRANQGCTGQQLSQAPIARQAAAACKARALAGRAAAHLQAAQ